LASIRLLVTLGFGVAMLSGIIFAIPASYHSYCAAFHWKPGTTRIWLTWRSAIYYPDHLDEIGLFHRSQAFKFYKKAFACWAVMLGLLPLIFLVRYFLISN
jgi:hypothetical protein